MLPVDRRITQKSDFDKIKAEGMIINSHSFSVSYIARDKSKPSRFGYIISTKISKQATIRNRAKRAIREGIRQQLAFIPNGFDCVFLAKPIIVKTYTDEILREVKEALRELKS